jgi:hypothetical protein
LVGFFKRTGLFEAESSVWQWAYWYWMVRILESSSSQPLLVVNIEVVEKLKSDGRGLQRRFTVAHSMPNGSNKLVSKVLFV